MSAGVGTACVYFRSGNPPPFPEPMLYLNGELTAPNPTKPNTEATIINNLCFPATVQPSYAPAGQTLVSVSTVGVPEGLSDVDLAERIKDQAADWFGADAVADWDHLRTYRIPYSQPRQDPTTDLRRRVSLGKGVFVAGDHRDAATHDAALASGLRAAEAVRREVFARP